MLQIKDPGGDHELHEEVEFKEEPQTEMEFEEPCEESEESEKEELERPEAVFLPVKAELEEDEEEEEETEEKEEDFLMPDGEDTASHQEWATTSEATYKIKMSAEIEEFKKKFDEAFLKLFVLKKDNSVFISSSRYTKLIQEVKRAKEEKKKSAISYRRLKRYDIVLIDGDEKLIVPLSDGETTFRYYVANENLFHILYEAHVSLGHGGKHRMLMKIKKKYANVTQEAVLLFLKFCKPCQEKRASYRKGLVEKHMVSSERNSRCQINLIDMQTQVDGDHRFILVYQDLSTKFIQLRALTSKNAEEVADHLLNIFCIFGAPSALQSENGEFGKQVIESLKRTWKSLAIVLGKPCHTQSQEKVEQANQDIQNTLASWIKTEGVNGWSQGLKYIQLMKNNTYLDSIKRTPYQAMFGHDMKVGASSFALPSDEVQKLTTENELEKTLKGATKKQDVTTNMSEHTVEKLEESEDVDIAGSERKSDENVKNICGECNDTSSDDFTLCNSCDTYIHTSCGIGNTYNEECDNFGVLCPLCRKKKCLPTNWSPTKESFIVHAEKASTTR